LEPSFLRYGETRPAAPQRNDDQRNEATLLAFAPRVFGRKPPEVAATRPRRDPVQRAADGSRFLEIASDSDVFAVRRDLRLLDGLHPVESLAAGDPIAVVGVEDVVVALASTDRVLSVSSLNPVLARASLEFIRASLAKDEVAFVLSVDRVLATIAVDLVAASISLDLIVGATSVDQILGTPGGDSVLTTIAPDRIVALASIERVCAWPAGDPVPSRAAVDVVGRASLSKEAVGADPPEDEVDAAPAAQQVSPSRSLNQIVGEICRTLSNSGVSATSPTPAGRWSRPARRAPGLCPDRWRP
jgi:hypothetical protein